MKAVGNERTKKKMQEIGWHRITGIGRPGGAEQMCAGKNYTREITKHKQITSSLKRHGTELKRRARSSKKRQPANK